MGSQSGVDRDQTRAPRDGFPPLLGIRPQNPCVCWGFGTSSPLLASAVPIGLEVGETGFEPATPWSLAYPDTMTAQGARRARGVGNHAAVDGHSGLRGEALHAAHPQPGHRSSRPAATRSARRGSCSATASSERRRATPLAGRRRSEEIRAAHGPTSTRTSATSSRRHGSRSGSTTS